MKDWDLGEICTLASTCGCRVPRTRHTARGAWSSVVRNGVALTFNENYIHTEEFLALQAAKGHDPGDQG